MELLQLKYFCDAAETENFSHTAQKYNVPASNISQTIHRLEEELGTLLFNRTSNKVNLSENGKAFYKGAKAALISLEEAKGKLTAPDRVCGEIRILIGTNRQTVTKVIESFKKKYNDVTFLINHNINSNDRNYEFIISDKKSGYKNFSQKLLISEKIMVAVSNNNHLAKYKTVDPIELKEEKFIMMDENSSMNEVSQKICKSVGFLPDVIIKCDDPFYVREYVEQGLGIAFVPSFAWKGMFSENVTLLDIGDFKRESYVFYSNYMTSASKLFLNELINAF